MSQPAPAQPAPRPLVGAIRWDAWNGGSVTLEVERSLGPAKYHDRLPWFAKVLDERTVAIDGSPAIIMEQEIAAAADAGLDYWAFLYYPEGNTMSAALAQYLESPARQRVSFCLILHNAFGVSEAQWPRECERAVALLQEPGYQTVLGGRPLVYAFALGHKGAFPAARMAAFIAAAKARGPAPYCVYMGWNPAADYPRAREWGFEAVSHYAYACADRTFGELTQGVETRFWAKATEARVPYVPLVSSGWDKQPRKDHPVSWEKDHGYHQQATFPATATPAEIAAHLARAIAFTQAHPDLCIAQAIIIYAWNEYDEGGWLAPTWTPTGAPNTKRLQALRTVLRPGVTDR